MEQPPSLRRCEPEGVDSLRELSIETFTDAFAADNDPQDFDAYLRKAFNTQQLSAELASAGTRFYFLMAGEALAGYFKINTGKDQTELQEASGMELERIYVRTRFQGRGLGAWMLQQVKQMAKREGKAYLWLGVWEKNTRAIAFYRSHGFVIFDKHPYYIGSDRQMDWMMRLDL